MLVLVGADVGAFARGAGVTLAIVARRAGLPAAVDRRALRREFEVSGLEVSKEPRRGEDDDRMSVLPGVLPPGAVGDRLE